MYAADMPALALSAETCVPTPKRAGGRRHTASLNLDTGLLDIFARAMAKCSAAVPAAVVGASPHTGEDKMPSRQPETCRRYQDVNL
jgi:hypothetical protein